MTKRESVLQELRETPVKGGAISPPPVLRAAVIVPWAGDLAALKDILWDTSGDFRGRWALARLPSGLLVGVMTTADGQRVVRLTVLGQATPQEQAEGQQLIRLWGLKGWAKTTEKAAVEHRITMIEPEVV